MATTTESTTTLPRNKRVRAPISVDTLAKQVTAMKEKENNERVEQFSQVLTTPSSVLIHPAPEIAAVVVAPPPPPPAPPVPPVQEEAIQDVPSNDAIAVDAPPVDVSTKDKQQQQDTEDAEDDESHASKRARSEEQSKTTTDAPPPPQTSEQVTEETAEQVAKRQAEEKERKRIKRNEQQRLRKEAQRKKAAEEAEQKKRDEEEISRATDVLVKHGGKRQLRVTRRSSCRCSGFRVICFQSPVIAICSLCSHELLF